MRNSALPRLPEAARACLALLACLVSAGCQPVRHAGELWTRPVDGARMVFVPAGEFAMGSDREMAEYARRLCSESTPDLAVAACKAAAFRDEQPAHRVRLDAFWLDQTEVTNQQYRACVSAGECDPPGQDAWSNRPNYYADPAYSPHPVVNVDWQMAAGYCAWADARLPTEAEWEYAARGPEARVFPWGDDFDPSRLNYCDASCPLLADESHVDGYPDTAPVGSFPSGASWIGALDMAGNVREWVDGWYGVYPSADTMNPKGPSTGDLRITRGGAWYDTPEDTRSTNRGSELPDYFRHNLGFRCAGDL